MSVESFVFQSLPATVVFRPGAVAETADWIAKAGGTRALLLSTTQQARDVQALAGRLGSIAAGVYANATMHTPVEVTHEALKAAREVDADCVVSYGGGSTVGLGKAISWRTGMPHIAIATTYAGSEVTPILGQTENGLKTTIRDPRILPGTVIYDPELTLGLPVAMSVTSGLNAMAHAVEALYARDRHPLSTIMATEGLKAMARALPRIVKEPRDAEGRTDALYGAWLCGSVLGQVGMALHHKICHTLGGSFDMPHSETHAVMLPHTAGFNAQAVPELMKPVAEIFGGSPGPALYDFAKELGSPLSLKAIGMRAEDIDRAADIATQNPYWNPRPLDRDAIREMLLAAHEGRRPTQ
jgi:maleylacetate reductase